MYELLRSDPTRAHALGGKFRHLQRLVQRFMLMSMEPTQDEIAQFQAIWRAAFDQEISSERARHELLLLVDFYETLDDRAAGEGPDASENI